MFIAPAYAEAAAAPGGSDLLTSLMLPAVLLVAMYFLMIRPQQRRMKAHQEMLKALKRNDMVVTNSGIIGKVKQVADDEVRIEIAPNTEVRVRKYAVAEVLTKSEPAPANDTKPA